MPGLKPFERVKCVWSPSFAYALGLLASDGCIGKDGSYIDFTSKDLEQVKNFRRCLGLNNKIGKKISGEGFISFRVQFRDVHFHEFLVGIGIYPIKSKTIDEVKVPNKYFFDFVRGVYDGDGSSYSYWDKRWKSSFMFYVGFASASANFLTWLQNNINRLVGVGGHITGGEYKSTKQLKYAKKDSVILLRKMYHSRHIICLSRKRLKNEKILGMIGKKL